MGLDAALGIAAGSLANITYGLSVVSQNVANASTLNYATESATQASADAGGVGIGVRSGVVIRATDQALTSELQGQNANASFWQTTNASLSTIQPILGTVGQQTDLASKLGAVQSAFSSLLNDPSDQTQQASVVAASATLAAGINTLSATYSQARQGAQDGLSSGVAQLNSALAKIGSLSDQIVALQSQGKSTADIENQRDQAVAVVSGLVDSRFIVQPNGDMMVLTKGGVQLPTHTADPLSIATASAGPTAFYPGGGLPGIMLGGVDVSAQMGGGQIGANLTLRDSTLPTYQGALDEFSQNLASRFQAQGLTLFSDASGNVPVSTGPALQSGFVGFAGAISVNPAVAANPSLVRDGTQAVVGSPTGASAYTPNPQNLAGFTGMIARVLDFALGAQVQTGVGQPAMPTAGLGPTGTLTAPFGGGATLNDYASSLTASQAGDGATSSSNTTDALAVQTTLSSKLTGETGVDMDTELSHMVELQNAYGANAKIVSAVQSMLSQIMNAVQ